MGDKNYLLLRYEAAKSFWARLVILKKKAIGEVLSGKFNPLQNNQD